ncbi:nucleotidyltransferase family protein [Paenibacillus athensensis]|uniref:D-glycero-D-manno-heptose 1-phosphate guanosyltransferase n=1 Tax=Paenibacillus athensensis TaxID=1967502 RepID=A0A4Y8Q5B5_9BACL|nr:nucleotidyltransferase family protein [Paenibacillus athensensis]MCD1259525.1 nucleotidyltransferase family protein [Paenibacillus athensensis]
MEAIVLAGGFGTRLQSVVSDVPKPMAPVRGVPFLNYIFNQLCRSGVTRIVLSTGFKHEIIESYYGKAFKQAAIVYSREEMPLGTGGAIKKAMSLIEGNHTLILNGDTMFAVHLQDMMDVHITTKAELTIAVKPMTNFDRYGSLHLKQNRVVDFQEKMWVQSGFISGGVYAAQTSLFDGLELPGSFSMEVDYLQRYVHNRAFMAYPSDAYFIDIGIPEDYHRAQEDLPE